MKKYLLPLFILLILVQLFVPAQMIWTKERVLFVGKEFKFETAPVDPIHPFKGNYVSLDFKANSFAYDSVLDIPAYGEVFIELGEDESGFAEIRNISVTKPMNNQHYVIGIVRSITYTTDDTSRRRVFVEYPFNEYYLDEYKAPKVEERFRTALGDTTRSTYAIVKVLNGDAVISDVVVLGQSVKKAFD